ncbi:hypothetical protein [Anaerophilus nitritogenes]|uniref:hypothetical protein n=1 Tax=Anaerophilus nitritogenes TaxID=2498136 RepID=UPI00101CFCAE|nr:hypothetical protein [Anaerophilus nitritogenes]
MNEKSLECNLQDNNINEKDLFCIARHIRQYVEASKAQTTVDFGQPCFSCKYAMSNLCNFYIWDRFEKLYQATRVKISPKYQKTI